MNNNTACKISCNVSLCETDGCEEADVCSTCNSSAVGNLTVTLYQGKCFTCNDSNCKACSANLTCGTCLNSSFIISSSSNLCVICADVNCLDCHNSTSACLECRNPEVYSLNSTSGKCESASCENIPNCITCGGTAAKPFCELCSDGFTAFNNSCVTCSVSNCLSCS